jgi:hypothetical protein
MVRRGPRQPIEAVEGKGVGEEGVQLDLGKLPVGRRDEIDGLGAARAEAHPLAAVLVEACRAQALRDRSLIVRADDEVEVARMRRQRARDDDAAARRLVGELRDLDQWQAAEPESAGAPAVTGTNCQL